MKKIKLIIALGLIVSILSVLGTCEREKSLEIWECELSDGSKVILNLYPNENKYYSIVNQVDDSLSVMFGNDEWVYYEMRRDTMYLTKIGDTIIEQVGSTSPNWLIKKYSKKSMKWIYGGVMPLHAIPIQVEYMFNRKK